VPRRSSTLVFPAQSPQIFVHEGVRQALERRLMAAFPGPVHLSITDNRHSIITHRVQKGVLHARVHHMFLDARSGVVDALVRYITRGDKGASAILGDFIEDNGFRVARRNRRVPLVTKGKHHDLLACYEKTNDRYFDGTMTVPITWGKRGTSKSKSRKTIKLGSYGLADRLIRVHPALDQKWVPRYFVNYIVYHEMLHHVIPGSRGLGRVNLHPPEFKEREREFRHFQRSLDWEKKHVTRLLRT